MSALFSLDTAFAICNHSFNYIRHYRLQKVESLYVRKLDPEKLKEHVEKYPDAYLSEIAEVFGCSNVAVFKAFRRLKVTRKKTKRFREQRAEQVAEYPKEPLDLSELPKLSDRPIVYVDETGIDTWISGIWLLTERKPDYRKSKREEICKDRNSCRIDVKDYHCTTSV